MVTRRLRIEDAGLIAIPEQVAICPGGGPIVYVLRRTDLERDMDVHSLWSVGPTHGDPRQLTEGPDDSAPTWSPAGTQIAFLRGHSGVAQIAVLTLEGGDVEELTALPLGVGAPRWSPDGSRIAFVAPVSSADVSDDSSPIVSDRLDYQADGDGFRRDSRRHVHVIDLGSRECRQVTSGDWDAAYPAWAPDGSSIAFTAATGPNSDLETRSPVFVVDVTAPAPTARLVALETGEAAAITWAPDGSQLVVIGTTREGMGHAHLLLVALDGSTIVDLAAAPDRNVMPGRPGYPGALPQFTADGRTVIFCIRDRGCTHVYAVSVDGGTPRPILAGADRSVTSLSVTGGLVAVVLETGDSFGEVVVVDVDTGAETVRTRYGGQLDGIELFVRERREFAISDGTVVEAWLTRDPEQRSPMPLLLDVHGGPHNAWNGTADDVHLYHQELVASGWAILIVNVRGSDGYGESFYTAGLGAWGRADADDFLEPIDALVAEGVADPGMLALTGYSYGGFMTCYLTSRDTRFAAAVAGGLISDLVSMAGTSDLGHMIGEYEYGGRPWTNADGYAASSPLTRADRVETPTLILHGGADMRCPLGQAQQWHTALRERGVPTRLVVYPGASHLFIRSGRPSHRADFNRRTVQWFEQWVRRYDVSDRGGADG